jgi:hypothetical protein
MSTWVFKVDKAVMNDYIFISGGKPEMKKRA